MTPSGTRGVLNDALSIYSLMRPSPAPLSPGGALWRRLRRQAARSKCARMSRRRGLGRGCTGRRESGDDVSPRRTKEGIPASLGECRGPKRAIRMGVSDRRCHYNSEQRPRVPDFTIFDESANAAPVGIAAYHCNHWLIAHVRVMNLDLTDEETAALLTAALLRELDGIIDVDRYFLSPRIKTLSRQSRNQRGDSIVRRCQSCREPDDGVAHGAL